MSKVKKALATVAAGVSAAAAQTGAVLDLSGVTTAVKTEVDGASPVIAAILGITIAIGVVIGIVKVVRR